jgi:hypothetical protein
MKIVFKILVASFLLLGMIQAKEKTLDERLAEARKNSEIFAQKASAFQENFGKDEQPLLLEKKKIKRVERPQFSTKGYKTVDIRYFGQFDVNGKTIYYDVDIDLETSSSKDDIVSELDDVVKTLNLPMDRGFYRYQKDKTVNEKMLNIFKKRVDVKSLKIKKLLLQ